MAARLDDSSRQREGGRACTNRVAGDAADDRSQDRLGVAGRHPTPAKCPAEHVHAERLVDHAGETPGPSAVSGHESKRDRHKGNHDEGDDDGLDQGQSSRTLGHGPIRGAILAPARKAESQTRR
jgi:hypothetical protein